MFDRYTYIYIYVWCVFICYFYVLWWMHIRWICIYIYIYTRYLPFAVHTYGTSYVACALEISHEIPRLRLLIPFDTNPQITRQFRAPLIAKFRTNSDFVFSLCLPNLLIGAGFGPELTFKTHLWNVDFIDLFTFRFVL